MPAKRRRAKHKTKKLVETAPLLEAAEGDGCSVSVDGQ